MKKIFGLFVFLLSFSCARVMAQHTETKVKPNKTVGDRMHNTVHPRHKRHHGYKIKHKRHHGHKTKHKTAYVRPEEFEFETMS